MKCQGGGITTACFNENQWFTANIDAFCAKFKYFSKIQYLIFCTYLWHHYAVVSLCKSGSIIVLYFLIILPDLHNKQRKHSPATDFYIYIYM